MGWFWADPIVAPKTPYQRRTVSEQQKSGCPMHRAPATPVNPQKSTPLSPTTACPYVDTSAQTPSASQKSSPASVVNALNPLNYMPVDLSQKAEHRSQTQALSTEREISSIPRSSQDHPQAASDDGLSHNWVYPSPQQMYNALMRKGYTDTPQDAVTSMVAVHNFLNEGAWAEIVEWERRFARGLVQGWRESRFGEEGSVTGAMIASSDDEYEIPDSQVEQPRLLRFMGQANKPTPKAKILQLLGQLHAEKYGGPPPFDRHDWFVERQLSGGRTKEIHYVIDYYAGPPEVTGEPVFYLDIRPALDRPEAIAERSIRWMRDLWWRASGGSARIPKMAEHREPV